MSQIPTIPGSAQVPDVQLGTKRDPRARIQALAGVRRVASAAEGAVDTGMSVIADYEEKKRKMKEGAFFNDSALIMMKATADYTSKLKGMKSDDIPKQWAAITEGVKETIKGKDDIKKLSPNALKLLNLKMNMWQGKTSAHFEEYSGKKAVTEAQSSAHATSQEALKTGNPAMMDAAKGAIDIAVKTGAWTPEQGKAVTDQFPAVLEKNQILNGIDHDAYATLQKINSGGYKKVPEAELNTLRNAAERQTNFVQRTTAADAINDFSTSGLPKTDKELADMKKTGTVTGEFVKNYKAMVAREDYHVAQDKQALMLTKLRDLDLADSDNPEKDVREVTDEAASLPPQLQKEIHTLAASRIKSAKTAQEKTVHAGQLDLMRQSFDESQARLLVAPRADSNPARWAESPEAIEEMSDEKFTATFGEDADKAALVKQAKAEATSDRLRYARAQKAYVEWSHTKKGNEAGPAEADAERERLGFGRYSSTDDVAAAYKAGKVDRGTAKEILRRQFGIP